MCRLRTPAWVPIMARVCSVLEPWDPTVGGLEPIQGGPDPILGVRFAHMGVLGQTWRPGPYTQGSGTLPWGSGLTVDALKYITFSGHVVAPTRPCGGVRRCCWPRVVARGWGESWPGPTYSSFTTRLKIAAWVLRLYTGVRGTLVSGYRHSQREHLIKGRKSWYSSLIVGSLERD
jgi:hypothetical protein